MKICEIIRRRYENPFQPGIKVNLYRNYEYRAMAKAIANLANNPIESVMVGDSYFMTHLEGQSTQLTLEQSQLAKKILPELVAEVRLEIERNEFGIKKPLLMADIPDGLSESELLKILEDYKKAGADMVKLELESEGELWLIRAITDLNMIPAIHLGYTPQKNDNKTYGTTTSEISVFKAIINAGIEAGVQSVIFERVAEVANQIMTKYCLDRGLLPYSIFSGRAPLGGQSLNVWDSVVIPTRQSIFFPPTSVIRREQIELEYNEKLITECFKKLVTLTVANVFPPSPRNNIELESYMSLLKESVL